MAQKFIKRIKELSKDELVELLQKNNYEFEEIQKRKITGEQFMNLTEMALLEWKLPPSERRKLWSCITDIQVNPEKMFPHKSPEVPEKPEKIVPQRPPSFKKPIPIPNKTPKRIENIPMQKSPCLLHNNALIEQLEQLIGHQSQRKPRGPTPEPEPEGLLYENLPQNPSDDEDEYSTPNQNVVEVEKSNYENPSAVHGLPNKLPFVKRQPTVLTPETTKLYEQTPNNFPSVQKPPTSALSTSNVEDNEEDLPTYEPIGKNNTEEQNNVSKPAVTFKRLSQFFSSFKRKTSISAETDCNEEQGYAKARDLSPRTPDGSCDNLPQDRPPANIKLPEKQDRFLPPFIPKAKVFSPSGTQAFDRNIRVQQRPLPPLPPSLQKNEHSTDIDDSRLAYFRSRENYEDCTLQNSKSEKRRHLPDLNPQTISRQQPLADQDEELAEYGSVIFNPNDEPLYRNTDRQGAKQLLDGQTDGAFLLRPSQKFFLTLSVKWGENIFHLGIEQTDNNKLRLNTDDDMSPEFATMNEFIKYFTKHPLTFEYEGALLHIDLNIFDLQRSVDVQ